MIIDNNTLYETRGQQKNGPSVAQGRGNDPVPEGNQPADDTLPEGENQKGRPHVRDRKGQEHVAEREDDTRRHGSPPARQAGLQVAQKVSSKETLFEEVAGQG